MRLGANTIPAQRGSATPKAATKKINRKDAKDAKKIPSPYLVTKPS